MLGLFNASNQLVNRYRFKPFGGREAASEQVPNALQYTARHWDPDTGLYQNRNRWYDPHLGRFISEDPIGLAGGINKYAYAGNNPVDNTDPFGLCVNNNAAVVEGGDVCPLEEVVVKARPDDGRESGTARNPSSRGSGTAGSGDGGGRGRGKRAAAAASDFLDTPCGAATGELLATAAMDGLVLLGAGATARLGWAALTSFNASNFMAGRAAYPVSAGYYRARSAFEVSGSVAAGIPTAVTWGYQVPDRLPPGGAAGRNGWDLVPGVATGRAVLRTAEACGS